MHEGDPRAARRGGRDDRRPPALAGPRRPRELDLSDELLARLRRIVIVACGTSYHAGPGRSLRDRAMGADPGRDGHRLRVPLPQPVVGPDDLVHRHHPVRRDGRHAGGDAPGPRARCHGARDHQHHGQPGRPAMPTRSSSRAPASRSASRRRRRSRARWPRCICSVSGSPRLRGTLDPELIVELIVRAQEHPTKITETIAVGRRPRPRDRAGPARAGASSCSWAATSGSRSASRAALKLKEISYIPTDAYAAGEMKHGPIALLDESTPGGLRGHRQPGAREGALEHRRGARPRRRRDRRRHRGLRRGRRRTPTRRSSSRAPTGCCSRSSRWSRCSSSPTTSPGSRASTWTSRATSRRRSRSSDRDRHRPARDRAPRARARAASAPRRARVPPRRAGVRRARAGGPAGTWRRASPPRRPR